jgi:hypothetical protein
MCLESHRFPFVPLLQFLVLPKAISNFAAHICVVSCVDYGLSDDPQVPLKPQFDGMRLYGAAKGAPFKAAS